MKKLLLSFLIFSVCTSQSFAFDGNRKGLVLDLGVGYSPYYFNSINTNDRFKDYNGLGLNASIGYAFNDNNQITFESIVVGEFIEYSEGFDSKYQFYGLSWNYYLNGKGKAFITKAGCGSLNIEYQNNNDFHSSRADFSFLAGIGIELSKKYKISYTSFFGRFIEDEKKYYFYVPYLSVSISFY